MKNIKTDFFLLFALLFTMLFVRPTHDNSETNSLLLSDVRFSSSVLVSVVLEQDMLTLCCCTDCLGGRSNFFRFDAELTSSTRKDK